MKTETDKEFEQVCKAVWKAKKKFEEVMKKHGHDLAYYPLRITVWETDENFKPFKKINEIDDRELSDEK